MNAKALTRAAILCIAWIAIATIGSELSGSFKGLLTTIGGHHWIGKSVLTVVFFGVFYAIFRKTSDKELSLANTWSLIGTTVVCGLAILIFYVQHS